MDEEEAVVADLEEAAGASVVAEGVAAAASEVVGVAASEDVALAVEVAALAAEGDSEAGVVAEEEVALEEEGDGPSGPDHGIHQHELLGDCIKSHLYFVFYPIYQETIENLCLLFCCQTKF